MRAAETETGRTGKTDPNGPLCFISDELSGLLLLCQFVSDDPRAAKGLLSVFRLMLSIRL